MTTIDKVFLGIIWLFTLVMAVAFVGAGVNGAWKQWAVDAGHAEWTIDQRGEKGWHWLEKPQ